MKEYILDTNEFNRIKTLNITLSNQFDAKL
jgi:hypothetical protein